MVQSNIFLSKNIPTGSFLVFTIGPHVVQVPPFPNVTELFDHLFCPSLCGSAGKDFVIALSAAIAVSSLCGANNTADTEFPIIGELHLDVCATIVKVSAVSINLAGAWLQDLCKHSNFLL